MENKAFDAWCRAATKEIRYPPDREQVHAELLAHLEDHRDAYIAEGMAEEAATEKALAAMGEAAEIAPALGKIHRPFWGYFYKTVKVLAIVLCILVLLHAWDPIFSTVEQVLFHTHNPGETAYKDLGVSQELARDDRTQVIYAEGYLFLLSDGALLETDRGYMVTVWLDIVNCSFTGRGSGIGWQFEATDSLGNQYACYADTQGMYNDRVRYCYMANMQNMNSYWLAVQYIPSPDIEWVELRYDRDGRDIVFRIDLTGGGKE